MLSKILQYYIKEKKLLTYFLVSSFFITFLDLYSPVVVQNLMDIAIPNKDINTFFKLSALLLFMYIGRFFISIWSSSKGQLMGNKIKFWMREDLFKKILSLPNSYFLKHQSGDIISRLTGDLENVSSLLYRGLEDLLFSILSIIGAIFLMVSFNPKLTILSFIPLPFAIYFAINQNKKLKKGYLEIRQSFSKLTSKVHNDLRVIFFLKDNLLEEKSSEKFTEANENLLSVEKINIFNISSLMSGINFYNQFTQLIIIFVGGYMHIKGELSFGVILSFILLTNRFRIYLLKLIGLIDLFQRGGVGITRFFEVMNTESEDNSGELLSENISSINLKRLNFSYDSKTILNDLTFNINKGEKVAVIGESGIGKTTLFSLLKKTLSTENNSLLINDKCISNLNRKSLLEKITTIDLNDNILNDTIYNNLKVVKENLTVDELYSALKLAHLDDFVKELDKKENSIVGQEGVVLSSGQKQRLALSRLFITKPDLILLDEGTSALDNILEHNIMSNILNSFKDSIIITIAHRLNTIKFYDKIIVLGKNGIEEIGTFDELMNTKGTFYKLYSPTE